jgi:hypothetical protein
MNKKLLTLLVGLILAAILVSCSITDLFNKKEETPPPAQEEQETQPPPPPPETQKPVTKPTKPVAPPKDTTKPADKNTTGETKTAEETAAEENIPKAGLGIIFVTNVRTGAFRVKVDDQKPPAIDHSFAGKKGGKAEEQRYEQELKFPPGEHKFKFVCEDNQGSKGIKEETFVFKPGQHKVVRITVKGAPGDIKLEIVE